MKDKNTAAILALFVGGFGGHRFYLRQPGLGVVYLLFCWTLIPALAAFVEGFALLAMDKNVFDAKYNPGLALPPAHIPASQNIVVNVAQPAALPSPSSSTNDFASALRQLHELKVAGALTEDEFQSEKQRLLANRS